MNSYTLRPVSEVDLETVMSFYRSNIGTPGCTWNQYYPNEDTLQEDYLTGNLYGLYIAENLIGAISISSKNFLDKLHCWQYQTNVREIARVVISPKYQRQGFGNVLLKMLFELLKKRGTQAIHLLVSPENERAMNLYSKFGFENRGQFFIYEHDYFAMESKI